MRTSLFATLSCGGVAAMSVGTTDAGAWASAEACSYNSIIMQWYSSTAVLQYSSTILEQHGHVIFVITIAIVIAIVRIFVVVQGAAPWLSGDILLLGLSLPFSLGPGSSSLVLWSIPRSLVP